VNKNYLYAKYSIFSTEALLILDFGNFGVLHKGMISSRLRCCW